MIDYIRDIAERLGKKECVIFYTVGSVTFEKIKELKNRYGILPTAVCDGDKKKQGRTYKGLEGLVVISPKEAMEKYPEGKFYVTTLDYKYEIFGWLVDTCGISSERIINYVPVKKIRSCNFIQKALVYDQTGVSRFCWRNPCPNIMNKDQIKAAELNELKKQLLTSVRDGGRPAHEACAGCSQIEEAYYPIEPKAWSINYFCQSVCNYKCSYCTLAHEEKPEHNAGRHMLGELIATYKKEGMLAPEYNVVLSTAGEPALHPKRKEFFESFDGEEFIFNTNGSLFDESLVEAMQEKNVLLISSIDAGTSETYKKIKGVDAWDKVKNNLSKYSKMPRGIVALKYIFIPGLNDTRENVDGFVELCEAVDATFTIVALDYYSVDKITNNTREMVKRMKEAMSDRNILCVPYTAWETKEYKEAITKLMAE